VFQEILRFGLFREINDAVAMRREQEERNRREIEERAASYADIKTEGGEHHGQEEGR
jgi:hypothetical protein